MILLCCNPNPPSWEYWDSRPVTVAVAVTVGCPVGMAEVEVCEGGGDAAWDRLARRHDDGEGT